MHSGNLPGISVKLMGFGQHFSCDAGKTKTDVSRDPNVGIMSIPVSSDLSLVTLADGLMG